MNFLQQIFPAIAIVIFILTWMACSKIDGLVSGWLRNRKERGK